MKIRDPSFDPSLLPLLSSSRTPPLRPPELQLWSKGVPVGKQQKASDGNNRRALGDIGNLVNAHARSAAEGKPQLPQISRPLSRSFGAQLLRNAQAAAEAAAVANNVQKHVKADDVGAAKGVTKPKTKAAATVKPKQETVVVEISPDTAAAFSGKKARSSKKKMHTYSSVLTARSKVACGISGKPAEIVPDIDAPDVGDQLAVVDYVEDIYRFYKLSENSFRPNDYMGSEVEINAKMRSILADWLIEVHHKFELMPETLYLTMYKVEINAKMRSILADWLIEVHHKFELMPETLYLTMYIIDRYLSLEVVVRRELQLVGMTSMLIACKYEEIWAPEVTDFICISDKAYTREQILAKEKGILDKLEWNLTVATPYVFLVRFLKAALSDKEMEYMVFFFADLGLMHYSMMIPYSSSMVAAASVYAARCTLNKTPLWTETLRRHTGFSEPELKECGKLLVELHSTAVDSKLRAVYKKYASPQRGSMALHPPATKLFEGLQSAEQLPASS
ncbi:hypothetical protein Taro_048631 [Colocasia esculenta]|uniref:Uncharacterized protein n=1 Tax=Colocasia esculenta TaxID=4460 RepID=A0A843X8N4_COLES|nr:hypothetical protein [Colocasia esculenta]